jgi:TolA-binding protein
MKRKENNHYYIYIIMILIGILIFCLIIILGCQIFMAIMPLREGLEGDSVHVSEPIPVAQLQTTSVSVYQPYNASDLSNNAAALPKQNASNIDYLNGQVMTLNGSNTKNQQSINAMQTQIDSLTKQQVEYVQAIGTPAPSPVEESEPEPAPAPAPVENSSQMPNNSLF